MKKWPKKGRNSLNKKNILNKNMGIGCCNEKGLLEKDNIPSYEQNNNDNNKTKENDEHNASNESFEEKELLEKKRTIGEGGFGKVILVETDNSKKNYAVKETSLDDMKKVKSFVKEKNILSKCHHPNIITFIEVFKDRHINKINIVLEYAESGTLKKKLNGENNIEENTLIFWLIQICLGLSYLHKKNIIHRDIKPENIFLTKTGLIKIGDLGLAKIYKSQSELERKSTIGGTFIYMAPEMKGTGIYNEKIDLYALGKTFKHFCELNKNYSEEFVNLINSLLNNNPDNRPSADEILKSPIIKRGMKLFLEKYNYEKSLSNLIMKKIDINNINYIQDDNFIEEIKKVRKSLIEKDHNEYNNEKNSKDLDIIMCLINKKMLE